MVAPRLLPRAILIVIVSAGGLAPLSARADGAIAMGDDNTYGWCSGYGMSEARDCALDGCRSENGLNCRVVLECDDRWASIATGDGGGYGMVCGHHDLNVARMRALVVCLQATRSSCHIQDAFSGSRRRDKSDNELFNATVLLQQMLASQGYYSDEIDGIPGPATRESVRRFQASVGLAATGEPEHDTIRRLVDAEGGSARVLEKLVNGALAVDTSAWHAASGRAARQAAQPQVELDRYLEALGPASAAPGAFGLTEADFDRGLADSLKLVNGNESAPHFEIASKFECRAVAAHPGDALCWARLAGTSDSLSASVWWAASTRGRAAESLRAILDQVLTTGAIVTDGTLTVTSKSGEKRELPYACSLAPNLATQTCSIERNAEVGLLVIITGLPAVTEVDMANVSAEHAQVLAVAVYGFMRELLPVDEGARR